MDEDSLTANSNTMSMNEKSSMIAQFNDQSAPRHPRQSSSSSPSTFRLFLRLGTFVALIATTSLIVASSALIISVKNKDDIATAAERASSSSSSSNGSDQTKKIAEEIDLRNFIGKRILFITAHPDDLVGSSGSFVAAITGVMRKEQEALQRREMIRANGQSSAAKVSRGGGAHISSFSSSSSSASVSSFPSDDDFNGTDIHVLVMSNGNAGCSRNQSVTPAQCAAMRAAEEADCDAYLGVKNARIVAATTTATATTPNVIVEQAFNDNHLWDGTYTDVELISVIVRTVRRIKPQVVISFYPDPIWVEALPNAGYGDMGFHPDHQKVGKLVASAVAGFAASNRIIYNETTFGEPWKAEQLWFWQFVSPTHCFTIAPKSTKTTTAASGEKPTKNLIQTQETPSYPPLLQRKIDGFLMHKTQATNATQIREWVVKFSKIVADNCGGRPQGAFAEGFIRYT